MDTKNAHEGKDQKAHEAEAKQGKKGTGNKGHNQYTKNDDTGKKGSGNKGHNQYTK